MDNCGSCKFWLKHEDTAEQKGYGDCQLFPPGPEHFPITHKQIWCGQWEGRVITPISSVTKKSK